LARSSHVGGCMMSGQQPNKSFKPTPLRGAA
jgi:hypothetical protein